MGQVVPDPACLPCLPPRSAGRGRQARRARRRQAYPFPQAPLEIFDGNGNFAAGRGLVAALKEMGVRALRYPGGEKSDGYLWSTPPYEKPRVTPAGRADTSFLRRTREW